MTPRRHLTLPMVFMVVLACHVSSTPARGSEAGTTTDRIRMPGHVPAALQRATRLPGIQLAVTGALDSALAMPAAAAPVTLTVVLHRSDQAGFERYLPDPQDRHSLDFQKWLSQPEIAARFGPSQEAYDKVRAFLAQSGFTLIEGSANRLTLTVQGTRAEAERAFAVEISDYRLKDRVFFANDRDPGLPPDLAPHVHAVIGLSNLAQPRPVSQAIEKAFATAVCQLCRLAWSNIRLGNAAADVLQTCSDLTDRYSLYCYPDSPWDLKWGFGPPPDAQPPSGAPPSGGYNGPTDDACDECEGLTVSAAARAIRGKAAAAAPLWRNASGAGQRIGLLQFDAFSRSDVADYVQLMGVPTPIGQLSQVHVNGGAPPGSNQAEVLLDIVAAMTWAPGADYVVYDGPFTGRGTSFQTMFNAMINDGVTVISNSWAYCEDQTTLADVTSIDSILAGAAASGIGVFNAAGDTGSTCLDGSPNTIAVPAGSPHATAVGGTSLVHGPGFTYQSETW